MSLNTLSLQSMLLTRSWKTFPLKGQIANLLVFVSHTLYYNYPTLPSQCESSNGHWTWTWTSHWANACCFHLSCQTFLPLLASSMPSLKLPSQESNMDQKTVPWEGTLLSQNWVAAHFLVIHCATRVEGGELLPLS